MIAELDPDLRLQARLALGKGWSRALLLLAATIGAVGLMYLNSNVVFMSRAAREEVARRGFLPQDPAFFQVGLFLLLFAPTRAVMRIVSLEQRGLLDLMRLCGRPPHRVLAGFMAGSMWPFLVAGIVLVIHHEWLVHQPSDLVVASVAFLYATAFALGMLTLFPAALPSGSGLLTALLAVLTAVAVGLLQDPDFRRLLDPHGVALTVPVFVLLPAAAFTALRRVRRPASTTESSRALALMEAMSRLIPQIGPPEFIRQLRRSSGSAIAATVLFAAPGAILWIATHAGWISGPPLPWGSWLFNLPWFVITIGFFVVSATIRFEHSATFSDLIRLTPQHPAAVAASWYAGLGAALWIPSIVAIAWCLALGTRPPYNMQWLVAFAVVVPAVGIVEGIQGRRLGSALIVVGVVAFMVAAYRVTITPVFADVLGQPELKAGAPAWLHAATVLPIVTAISSICIVAGRLARPEGAPLSGGTAIVGVAAVVICTRAVVMREYLRALPLICAMLAPFAAESRRVLTRPWLRIAPLAATALFGAAAVCVAGGLSWTVGATTGAAAAMALAMGILTHELTWTTPALSAGLRLLIALPIVKTMAIWTYRSREAIAVDMSPFLDAIDLTWIAAAFAAAAILFTYVRLKADATSRSSRS